MAERTRSRDARDDSPDAGTELEREIIAHWERSRGSFEKGRELFELLLQWILQRTRKLETSLAEAAYDRFIDRILNDLPAREPRLTVIRAYWRHSMMDAKRTVARERQRTSLRDLCSDEQETFILGRELDLLLAGAIRRLAPRAREVLVLRGEGLRYAQIARSLGITASCARATCTRARAAILSCRGIGLPNDRAAQV